MPTPKTKYTIKIFPNIASNGNKVIVLITFVIEVVSIFIKRKKGDIDSLKIKEKENAEKMFYSLSKDNGNIEFFYNLARSRHQNVKKNKKFILICHQDNTKVALFPFLKFQTMKLTIDNIYFL